MDDLQSLLGKSTEGLDLLEKYKEIEAIYNNSLNAMSCFLNTVQAFSTDSYSINSYSVLSTSGNY